MSDDVNPPEAPIEPIRTEWTLYTSSETTTEPWVFSLTLTAPYVTPTQAEIVDAVLDGVFAATGIRLQAPAPPVGGGLLTALAEREQDTEPPTP